MIGDQWVRLEAMRLSKLAAKQEIRDLGLKVKDDSAKEITLWAEEWFDRHKASVVGQATVALVLRDCLKNARKPNSRAKQREQIHG